MILCVALQQWIACSFRCRVRVIHAARWCTKPRKFLVINNIYIPHSFCIGPADQASKNKTKKKKNMYLPLNYGVLLVPCASVFVLQDRTQLNKKNPFHIISDILLSTHPAETVHEHLFRIMILASLQNARPTFTLHQLFLLRCVHALATRLSAAWRWEEQWIFLVCLLSCLRCLGTNAR